MFISFNVYHVSSLQFLQPITVLQAKTKNPPHSWTVAIAYARLYRVHGPPRLQRQHFCAEPHAQLTFIYAVPPRHGSLQSPTVLSGPRANELSVCGIQAKPIP